MEPYRTLQNQLTLLSNAGKMEMRTLIGGSLLPGGEDLTSRQKRELVELSRRSGLILGRKYREGAGVFSEEAFREFAAGRVVNKHNLKQFRENVESILNDDIIRFGAQFEAGTISRKKYYDLVVSALGDAVTNHGRVMTRSLIEGSGTGFRILKEPSSCGWCNETAKMWEENGSRELLGFHKNCRCQVVPDLSIVSFVI